MPIPALGILGAAAISAVGSALMNRRAEKVAQRNAEQQRQWQLEDRAHEEAYNDPQAQLARLRAAGINPMNSGSIGVGESAVPNAPAIESVEYSNPGEAIAEGVSTMANYQTQQQDLALRRDQLELDKKKVENEINKTRSDIEVNETIKKLNEKTGNKTDAEAKKLGEEFKMLETQNQYYAEQLRENLNLTKENVNEKKLTNKFLKDTYEERVKTLTLTNRKIRKEIDEIASRIGLNHAQTDYWKAQATWLNEQICYDMPFWQSQDVMNGALDKGVAYNISRLNYDFQKKMQPIQLAIQKNESEFQKAMYPIRIRDAKYKDNWIWRTYDTYGREVMFGMRQQAKDIAGFAMQAYGVKGLSKIGSGVTTIGTNFKPGIENPYSGTYSNYKNYMNGGQMYPNSSNGYGYDSSFGF